MLSGTYERFLFERVDAGGLASVSTPVGGSGPTSISRLFSELRRKSVHVHLDGPGLFLSRTRIPWLRPRP
ncbi:MAG: hypothetical protein ACLP7F_22520 [Acidimicrobiales bacterium]